MSNRESHLSPKAKKTVSIISIIIFVLFFAAIAWFVGVPMIKFVKDPEQFRLWIDSKGFGGKLAFIGMQIIQIVIAIIPGEPLELGAGYAFGAGEGLILSFIGVVIGTVIIFSMTRYLGMKLLEAFFSREKINSLKFLQNEKRLYFFVFILFFIPATPKDLLSYFGGLTKIKMHIWLLLTTFTRIPSILTSTVAGDALGDQKYGFAVITIAVTLLISGGGILTYNAITKRKNAKNAAQEAKNSEEQQNVDKIGKIS